ncbi:type IV pilus modification PilV family protein [Rossellomorea marisflavi]|uniref:type IV pilus modification PilV family protein n=1 Tax=Rossellomorea marisflavi TaxID=189381 RepID=UPI00345B0EA1
MKRILQYTRNARGITLVEILASLVILSVILAVFVPLFGHSMTSTKVSEDRLDATFVAQTTMEEVRSILMSKAEGPINGVIKKGKKRDIIIKAIPPHEKFYCLEGIDFCSDKEISDSWEFYSYQDTEFDQANYFILVSIKSSDSQDLSEVIVRVFKNPDDDTLLAQMETIIAWGGN